MMAEITALALGCVTNNVYNISLSHYASGEYNFSACAVAFEAMPSPAEIIWWKSHSLSTIKRRSNCEAENMGRAPLAAALIGYFNWKTWSHLLFVCHFSNLYSALCAAKTVWKCELEDAKNWGCISHTMTKVSHSSLSPWCRYTRFLAHLKSQRSAYPYEAIDQESALAFNNIESEFRWEKIWIT